MNALYPYGRLAIVALLLVANGCLAPQSVSTESANSDKIERRESVMLRSKLGSTPSRAGFDSRAREIEQSLGIR
jgi:hypothetical protein